MRTARYFRAFARGIVSIGFLYLLFSQFSASSVAGRLAVIPAWAFAGAIMAVALQAFVLAWRWHRVAGFTGGHLRISDSIRLTFIALFLNQALPTSVGGDVARVWGAYHLGNSAAKAVTGVMAERLTGLFAIALLVTLPLPWIWHALEGEPVRLPLLLVGPVAGFGMIAIGLSHRMPFGWLPARVQGVIAEVANGLAAVSTGPRVFFELTALGLLSSSLLSAAAYIYGTALGLSIGAAPYLSLFNAAILISVLPVSIGGWGIREASIVILFSFVGAGGESALAISLLTGASMLVVSLPGALFIVMGSWSAPSELPDRQSDNSG